MNIPTKLHILSRIINEETENMGEIDKMLEYAEGMMIALESYEAGLDDVLNTYELDYVPTDSTDVLSR